ncbi:MAG: hypothetical protein AB1894_24045 [Chloroflexota bacterium]
MINTPTLPTCPTCKQTDQIRKVTSLYALNTKEWSESYSRTDAWGHTETVDEHKEAHTSLGLKLKPPPEPSGPTHPGLWYGIGGLVAFILLSALCPLVMLPLSLVIPALAGSTFVPDVSGVPAWAVTAAAIGVLTLCVGGLGIGLLVWLGLKVKRRFKRDLQNYKAKRATFERDELPRWQRAQSRWEQLYFCMRDETVFIPAENKAIKAEDMLKYLYDPMFRSLNPPSLEAK